MTAPAPDDAYRAGWIAGARAMREAAAQRIEPEGRLAPHEMTQGARDECILAGLIRRMPLPEMPR